VTGFAGPGAQLQALGLLWLDHQLKAVSGQVPQHRRPPTPPCKEDMGFSISPFF
jgi:hypothetical protein